jgi:hypothetical protein
MHFVQADGRSLPFDDRAFDVVHSNAVIEHVGPLDEQRRFVSELVRVAAAGFITTPNRWFPIEAHTRLPLVHWLPRSPMSTVLDRLGRKIHGDEWDIWLLSYRRFKGLFPTGLDVEIHTQRAAGWPATFIAVFRHP